ncbi:MAG: toprim domain-containing protein [Chitinophagaceae bacterium]
MNTPENEIYVKSKLLYGMYFARQEIDRQNECLLVEGYTDVISLHQAGIENVVASGGTSLTPDQLRLIRKYTHNLTIVYDGDSAGIKAASRGLDLALEEGLNVKLILIPDNEDPDSYVQKIGTSAFKDFVASNKKDIILFQLEVALNDVGNDSQKKATVVNQIAETISRINKAEDFTKQQDYIQRCADLLKIDEAGLTSLVNKYIRERISQQDSKTTNYTDASTEKKEIPDTSLELLLKDELHEKALVRTLLEYGLKTWDEEKGVTVADHIFHEIAENGLNELFDLKPLLEIIDIYKIWYEEGIEPTTKNFLYYENQLINQLVVSLIDNTASELSPNWKEKYETDLPGVEQLYKIDVTSSMAYLKLKKIKRLLIENQKDLANALDKEMQINLLETQLHLKYMEKELALKFGIVIMK